MLSSYCANSHTRYSFGRVHINRYLRGYIRSTYIRLDNSSRVMFLPKQGNVSISADNSKLGQEKHLVSARELNICWSKFFASPIERNWFQRPRLVKPRSRSSASESCEAMATSELDDMLSIPSREDILAILAFGDMEEALESKSKEQHKNIEYVNTSMTTGIPESLMNHFHLPCKAILSSWRAKPLRSKFIHLLQER